MPVWLRLDGVSLTVAISEPFVEFNAPTDARPQPGRPET